MGSTFCNISIMKSRTNHTEAYIKKCLKALMEQKRYTLVASDSNAEFVFMVKVDPASKWITVYSDCFDDNNPDELDEYGAKFSQIFKSPILCTACFDSDFMQLHLIDAGKNLSTYAVVGHPYDEIQLPEVDYAAWEPYAVGKGNNTSIEEICESEYVFAEDVLRPLGDYLGFHAKYLNMSYDTLKEFEDVEITYRFYFAKAEVNNTILNNEPVNLQSVFYSMMPAFIDKPSMVSCINLRGTSKGLAIYFVGPYVEEESITFSSVELFYTDHKNKKEHYERINIPLELKKVQQKDGTLAYYAECPEFEIPEKVDSNLKGRRLQDEQFARMFGVRFVPHGDGKQILDITIAIIPLYRFENQVVWNVWRPFGSKEAFIDHHNASWESKRETNSRVDDILLDKNYYLA